MTGVGRVARLDRDGVEWISCPLGSLGGTNSKESARVSPATIAGLVRAKKLVRVPSGSEFLALRFAHREQDCRRCAITSRPGADYPAATE